MDFLQQGDVLIKRIDEIPNGFNKIDDNKLALGEATGHFHGLYGGQFSIFDRKDAPYPKYLMVNETTFLKHQEHNKIEIKPGVYEIGIVREYDHFQKLIRKVRD